MNKDYSLVKHVFFCQRPFGLAKIDICFAKHILTLFGTTLCSPLLALPGKIRWDILFKKDQEEPEGVRICQIHSAAKNTRKGVR